MATILGLAARITADGSKFQDGLTPVERALKQLDAEAAKVTAVFKQFANESTGAAESQKRFDEALAGLLTSLRDGKINATEYADEFARLTEEAKNTAAAFAEGVKLTEQNRTEEEKRADALERLNELLRLGAIDQNTFNAAAAKASGAAEEAAAAAKEAADATAAAEKAKADATARAAEIIEANLSKEERAQKAFMASLAELDRLREQGLLTSNQYVTALGRVSAEYDKARAAADKFAKAGAKAGDAGTGKFRDLGGILSALPGPFGQVGASLANLGGTADAVAKLVGGGLTTALKSVGQALPLLLNPLGLVAAGIVAVVASSAAAAAALASLASRVESLSFAARQAGVDFQTIQILEEAANRAGTSVEALATGMQKFGRQLSEAAQGTGEAYKGLRELGFSLQEIQQGQNDPTAFAARVSKALDSVAAPADRARLQLTVLGKGGESLVRAFGELEGATEGVRRFGGAITDLDKDRLLELDSAFEDLSRAALGLGRELLTPFIGQIQSLTSGFAPALTSLGRVLGNLLDVFSPVISIIGLFANAALQATSAVLNLVATALEPFAIAARGIGQGIDEASKYVTKFWTGINDTIESVRTFFGGVFGGVAETAEKTAAAVAATAEETEAAAKAAVKAQEELEKAIQNGSKALDDVIKKSAEFGQAGFDAAYQFQEALADLDQQAADLELNAEQYTRGVANATAEYERQIEAIKKVQEATKKAAEEAKRKAEEDKKRLDALLKPSDEADKIQQDIQFIIEQQKAATEALAAARSKANVEEANAAAARLAQLDGLRTKLEDQQAAIQQGFSDGFSAAFTRTAESLNGLTNKAAAFGNEGAKAAAEIQARVATLQEQARAGIFTQAAYDAEVARDVKLFEERLARIEELRNREKQARADVFNAQVEAANRVEQYLTGQQGARATAELALADEVARRRQQAALNIEAIENRLAQEKQRLEAAREQNDRRSSAAAALRVKELEKALLVEQKIFDGRIKQIDAQRALASQQEQFARGQADAANQQQQAQQAYADQQAKIFESQQRAAAAEADRQRERINGLNTLGSQTIAATDVRTQQGASLVIDLASQAQDPTLIQQRLQTKFLQQIATGIGEAASNYFNKPVAIVGYSSFQGNA